MTRINHFTTARDLLDEATKEMRAFERFDQGDTYINTKIAIAQAHALLAVADALDDLDASMNRTSQAQEPA